MSQVKITNVEQFQELHVSLLPIPAEPGSPTLQAYVLAPGDSVELNLASTHSVQVQPVKREPFKYGRTE